MEIKSLRDLSMDDLYAAHEDAFSDYERSWTRPEYEKMLHRRGYVPELSFGAFDGQRLVSFTFNGIGMVHRVKTAYDAGTGTVKEYRGQRLATKIFTESVPFLKEQGVKQYLLEVLQRNTAAVAIYTNMGFTVTREFNYFVQAADTLVLNEKKLPSQYHLAEIDLSKRDEKRRMWDFTPSWQNSFAAISRNPEDFKIIGAFAGAELTGYGIAEPASGDIPQLAVSKKHRRQGIGSAILKEFVKHNDGKFIRVINTETTCQPIVSFLESNGIGVKGKQFEMMKAL